MFTQIIYLPKFGNEQRSNEERLAITGIYNACDELDIPLWEWDKSENHNESKNTLFLSLGGDGTMLTAMRESMKYPNSTVMGINFGKLGFLTSTDKFQLSEIYSSSDNIYYTLVMDLFYNGNNWDLTQRMALGASMQTGNSVKTEVAVNEFLVTTPTRRNPLQYDIMINGQLVAEHQGDGVIISTASGSTAYSLSAGGAIMTPSSTAIQIVPLAAHTLTAKPIVVGGEDKISIHANLDQRAGKVSVFNDGCAAGIFNKNCGINFQLDIVDRQMVNVWYPRDWNFFNVLTEKMGW